MLLVYSSQIRMARQDSMTSSAYSCSISFSIDEYILLLPSEYNPSPSDISFIQHPLHFETTLTSHPISPRSLRVLFENIFRSSIVYPPTSATSDIPSLNSSILSLLISLKYLMIDFPWTVSPFHSFAK